VGDGSTHVALSTGVLRGPPVSRGSGAILAQMAEKDWESQHRQRERRNRRNPPRPHRDALTGPPPNEPSAEKQKPRSAGFLLSGAGNETRTRDLNLGKVALYQLSYSRMFSTTNPASRVSNGGLGRNRTGVRGFAIRCITTLLPGQTTSSAHTGQLPRYEKTPCYGVFQNLERETRLELATSTLARLRSTN
jgi:hypothetical protein